MKEGNSTLIRLPPKAGQLDAGWSNTLSQPEDLARKGLLDGRILDRVLRRGDIFAQYRILGFIAAGGMGEIYAAERLDDDGARRQPVALKVVSAEFSQDADTISALRREAELCASVFSSHTVGIYEYGIDETGRGFVAMEFLYGEELFDRMRTHKLFPLKALAELSVQVLEALEDIHAEGIVHRDIKPENIYLAKTPRGEVVKILDFGIASRVDDDNDPLLDKPGQIFGTPQYLSPEQTRNPRVDARADLYSLGIVLYECANGRPPFDKETPYATMLAHQKDAVPPLPSSFDIEFCEIIYRSLAKNPDDRYQSAREMREVIERWIADTSWTDGFPGLGMGTFALSEQSDELAFDDIAERAQQARHPKPKPVEPRRDTETPFMPQAAVVKKSTRLSQEIVRDEIPQFPLQQRSTHNTPSPGVHSLKQVKEDSLKQDGLSALFGEISETEDDVPIDLALTRDEEAQRAAQARKAAQVATQQAAPRPQPAPHAKPPLEPQADKKATTVYVVAILVVILIGAAIAGGIMMKANAKKAANDTPTIIE